MDEPADRGGVVAFDGGPRHGETEAVDHHPAVIGTGREGGVYQRTEERRDALTVYRWEPLSEQAVAALTRGDLRANQPPGD